MNSTKTILVQIEDKVFEQEKLKSLSTAISNQQYIISGIRQKLIHIKITKSMVQERLMEKLVQLRLLL